MIPKLFRQIVLSRVWLCFVVMCLGFSAFGLGTLNLFLTLRANLGLIVDHGLMALMEGAAAQFFELISTLILSMLGYVVFKACEHELVNRLSAQHHQDPNT